jgi:hypothetical protein
LSGAHDDLVHIFLGPTHGVLARGLRLMVWCRWTLAGHSGVLIRDVKTMRPAVIHVIVPLGVWVSGRRVLLHRWPGGGHERGLIGRRSWRLPIVRHGRWWWRQGWLAILLVGGWVAPSSSRRCRCRWKTRWWHWRLVMHLRGWLTVLTMAAAPPAATLAIGGATWLVLRRRWCCSGHVHNMLL